MFSLLPLIALAAVASAATLTRDGDFRGSLSGRIVGGENTTIEEVPYQISVQLFNEHHCGGSIISKHWVVTAAHCMQYGSSSLYKVRAGSTVNTSGGSRHNVASIVSHKKYGLGGRPTHDIALIRVVEPFEFDETRQPIALFEEDEETPVGAIGTVTGWGTLHQGGSTPVALQTVDIPIVSKADCNKAYAPSGGIPENQICAAVPEGGKDSCQGDSGGPLAVGGRLSGIVSWGRGCAVRGIPGVYTEVAAYRAWIKLHSGV